MFADTRLTPEDPTHGSQLVAGRVDPRPDELVSPATESEYSEYSEFGDRGCHRGNAWHITSN